MKREILKSSASTLVKEYVLLTLGVLSYAIGWAIFLLPHNLVGGGVSGFASILYYATNIPMGLTYFVVNVILLLIGTKILGRGFGAKTIYAICMTSVMLAVMPKIIPDEIVAGLSFDNSKLICTCLGGLIAGFGIGLSISQGGSTGGTDIVAMILKKYTNLDISRALFVSDAVLVLAAFFIFNIQIGLFSLLGLILKSFIVDIAIDGIYKTKCFYIITSRADEILEFINNKLHRGATVSLASGSFSHEDKKIILTVLSRGQAMQLKTFIASTGDGSDFTIITNSSDIIGKGFRSAF
jgi:uncharacterized membrane-anchored protein YitT (DUF2179 family)